MNPSLIIAPSPHIHSGNKTQTLMRDVLLALIPAQLVSLYFFGLPALLLTAVSVASCMAAEYLIAKYLLKTENTLHDLSAVVTGLLLAFNLPVNLSPGLVAAGALFAIAVGKMSFGGLGCNPFNPALVGRVFLLISFPVQMTSWPVPNGFATPLVDAATGATPLALIKEALKSGASVESVAKELPATLDLLLGKMGGSMGEVSAIALLLGMVWLLVRKVITWHIPVATLGTLALITGLMWLIDRSLYMDPLFHLLTGGAILGAVYMATDYVSSPMTRSGMLLYGAGIGLLTGLIRLFGAYPEGMSFAILIMNGMVPLINNYIKPQRFGREALRHG